MKHDGCKLCKYENCSMESKECIGCKQNATDKYTRMTNADRIHSFSDEKLAEFLCKVKSDYQWADHEFPSEEECGDWVDWLQKDVEG